MADPKKGQAGEVPDLPPVDPAELEEAARRFIGAKKPPGGWNRGAKQEKKPSGQEEG
jgi:hypothetical protein